MSSFNFQQSAGLPPTVSNSTTTPEKGAGLSCFCPSQITLIKGVPDLTREPFSTSTYSSCQCLQAKQVKLQRRWLSGQRCQMKPCLCRDFIFLKSTIKRSLHLQFMNLIEQEQLLVKDIFHIRLNLQQTGDSLVTLREFPKDVLKLGKNVSLVKNQTYFDSLVMERLQIPETNTIAYLAECLGRCNYQKEKPWNQNEINQEFINYSIKIIRDYIFLVLTEPSIFPEQHVLDAQAEKSPDLILAMAQKLMTFFQTHGFDFQVFSAVYPRIEEENKNSNFIQLFFEVLLARQRFQTLGESKGLFYVDLLKGLLQIPAARAKFVSLPKTPFLPDIKDLRKAQGYNLDAATPLGLFARPSLLGSIAFYHQQVKANMNFEQRIDLDFGKIKYKKDFDAKLKYYTTMQLEYIPRLIEVFKQMFKKDLQKIMFRWLYFAIVGNQQRAKLGSRLANATNSTTSHDGLMMNIYECMLQISKIIVDRSQNKWQNVDPDYFRVAQHARLCQYQPLHKKDKDVMQIEKEFGTITQFYAITFQLLHCGVIPTLLNFREINETKQRLQKELEKLGRNHPLYIQGQRQLRKLKIKFFQYYLVVFDDVKVKSTIKLLDSILWLLPIWVGIDWSNFRRGKLVASKPQMLRFLPEFLLNDVFEYHQFYCRIKENYVQMLGEQHVSNIISILTALLAIEGNLSSNPYVCANYVELLYYFIAINKNIVINVLGQHQIAIQNITIGLARFYSDIAFTGSSHQFYSKYKYRFYANKIFTTLWQDSAYQKALRNISKTDIFERFINMIMTDSTYCFDEINEKYEKLKEFEMKRANSSMTPQDNRSEEMMQGAMAGNLQQSVSNLKLLKSLSNWSPQTFHTAAFLQSIVVLLNGMLKTIIDPTSFVNNRQVCKKYKFEKEFMLADVLSLYVNLHSKDVLINEIIRDQRYYKKENFTKALQKATNENCADDTTLQKFEEIIRQLGSAKMEEDGDQVYGEIPEQYQCSIMGTLMKDPVLLPTSHHTVDRVYIHKHLLNDQRDPFNRKPLKSSELVEQPKLKQEIEEWKKKRLEELRNSKSKETKYGKKGQKKKESENEGLFKDNFIKYEKE